MPHRLLFFLFIFMLLSCSQKARDLAIEEEVVSPDDLFTTDESIIPLLDELSKTDKAELIAFYKNQQYKPHFYDSKGNLSNTGKQLKNIVSKSLYYGLPQKRIYTIYDNVDSLHDDLVLLVKDVQLTMGILRFIDDLQHGYSDSLKIANRALKLADISLIDTIKQYTNKEQINALIKRHTPSSKHYEMLATELKNHLDTADLSLRLFEISLKAKDSIFAYADALKNLHLKHFPYSGDEDPIDVIKRFQHQNSIHSDGKIGETTKFVLEESPLDIAYKIAWNMEKIRYEINYPKQYVKVNIPEFRLYYFNDDTIASTHNVVVGKMKNQTPTLTSRINRIQVYPYWTVPYKIATKEILPAVKSNRSYLERNQMEILRGESTIDPHTINWKKLNEKNFPYRVRQLPGEKNSLGIVKFEFYNKYDVYVHDTPQKYLLSTPNRMYSHGCIRCQSPIDLAKKMIEINEKKIGNNIIPDSLDSMIVFREQRSIYIKGGIPIFVEYNTVPIIPVVIRKYKHKPDEYEEQVFYFRDIYYRDEENIRFFFYKKEYASIDGV